MNETPEIPAAKRPNRMATLLELRAPLDWATLVLRAPHLLRAPRGDGRPVMLLPGYGTSESSMRPLGRYLKFLGYDVYEWGLGRNLGKVDSYTQQIGARTKELHDELDGTPLTLIGWSLGGVIARETARLFAPYVREVITLGTPIVGGPKYTAAAERFAEASNIDLDKFEVVDSSGNADHFDYPETLIIVYGEDQKMLDAAELIRNELEAGKVEMRPRTQDITDITIVVGKDYANK